MRKVWNFVINYSYWFNIPLAFIVAGTFVPTAIRLITLGVMVYINFKRLYDMWKAVN